MPIFIERRSKVICQGFTGHKATFHCRQMLEYGTQLVGGVTPGRGGTEHLGLPVFNTVRDAVDATGATVSIVFVPAPFAGDALLEAAEAGIELVVCITQGIPVHDMIKARGALHYYGTKLVGPNSPGVITVGESKVGIMPGGIYTPGTIGIVSRSDMMTYEAALQTTRVGLGQTTCVGIGADPVHGLSLVRCLELFEADRKTKGIVLVGEIGGSAEEEAAEYIKAHVRKPVVAYIAGVTAPMDKRMGHAGVILSGTCGTAREKFHALEAAGAAVVRSPADMGLRMLEFFEG